ncbi:ankyrin [Tricholoma matsutake]|nr:ankyrin [Tricholoma matsutake 945]
MPTSKFDHAAAYLSDASSLSNVSTAIKLELYGLFKCITVAMAPSTSRPSIFDMIGRAKWDAWTSAGRAFVQCEDAEHRYLEIARSLGWAEDVVTQAPKDKGTLSGTWEEDDTPKSYRNAGTGSRGMGGTVSTMLPLVQEPDESMHGLAISNDASALSTLLENNPTTNVNELDEFGYTPLHLACDRGNLAVVQILLGKGADATIKDPDGFCAIELAHVAGHDDIQKYLALPP